MQNNGCQVASVVDLRSGESAEFGDSVPWGLSAGAGLLGIRNVDWNDVSEFGAKVFKVTLA